MRRIITILALLWGAPAGAETWQIALGARVLGTLSASADTLTAVLDNTPLGAGDGTFDAKLTGGLYRADSRSETESRRIEITFENGRVRSTKITPDSERTDASDPRKAPPNALDPISGFERLASARDCVAPFAMYDGRRVIQITPTARLEQSAQLTCRFDYDVIGGPGHISPFRLTQLRIEAFYARRGTQITGLERLTIRAGPFVVTVSR